MAYQSFTLLSDVDATQIEDGKTLIGRTPERLEEQWAFSGHQSEQFAIYSIATDQNGYVYSGSGAGSIRKIDSTGTEVWAFTGHDYGVYGLVAHDGYLYSASLDDTIKKISQTTGNQIWSFSAGSDVNSIALDLNNNYIYGGVDAANVVKLDFNGNEITSGTWPFTGHNNNVSAVTVDSNGYVYSGSWDQTLRKIDSTGSQIWSFSGHTNWINGVAVDSNGYSYTGSWDYTIRKIDPTGSEVWKIEGTGNSGYNLSLNSSEQYLYVGDRFSGNYILQKVSTDSGQIVWSQNINIASSTLDSQDNIYVGDGYQDGSQYLVRKYKENENLSSKLTNQTPALDILNDTAIENLSSDQSLQTTYQTTQAELEQWQIESSDLSLGLETLIIDQDGNTYVGGVNNNVHKYDPEGTLVWTFTNHTDRITQIIIDSDYVYTASFDGTIRKLNINDGSEVWTHTNPVAAPYTCLSIQGDFIYAGDFAQTVRKIPISGGTENTTDNWPFSGHTATVTSITTAEIFRTTVIISGDQSGTLKQLDGTGTEQVTTSDHSQTINVILFDTVRGAIYTASSDNTIIKASGGSIQWTFSDHTDDVTSLTFRDDFTIVSGSTDGTIRNLDPSTGNQIWSISVDGSDGVHHDIDSDFIYYARGGNGSTEVGPYKLQLPYVIWSNQDHTLQQLADVVVESATNSQVLTYNDSTGQWENADASGGGGGASTLDDLTDVDAYDPYDGYQLVYDDYSGTWVAQEPTGGASELSDLTDIYDTLNPSNNHVLMYDNQNTIWESKPISGDVNKKRLVLESTSDSLENNWNYTFTADFLIDASTTDSKQNLYVTARKDPNVTAENSFIEAIDSTGSNLWTHTLTHEDQIEDMALSNDENHLFTLERIVGDHTIQKLDTTNGQSVLSVSVGSNAVTEIDTDDNGFVYYAYGTDVIIADSQLNTLYQYDLSDSNDELVSKVKVEPNGEYFYIVNQRSWYLRKIKTRTGSQVWEILLHQAEFETGPGSTIETIILNDGYIYTSNSSSNDTNDDGAVNKIDSDGTIIWSWTTGPSTTKRQLAVDKYGYVYAAEAINKLDPNGNVHEFISGIPQSYLFTSMFVDNQLNVLIVAEDEGSYFAEKYTQTFTNHFWIDWDETSNSIEQLNDVSITTKENNQSLVYNKESNSWILKDVSQWRLIDVTVINLNNTHLTSNKILADTTSNAIQIILPSSPKNGQSYDIVDPAASWSTNNLTIDGNGLLIEGEETYVLSTDNERVEIIFFNSSWIVRPDVGTPTNVV